MPDDMMPQDAPAIQFLPAQRSAMRQIIALIGASGSGKTLSALKLARGLIGPNGKLGLVDTEKGRSAVYAGENKFLSTIFNPPFTPARYITHIDAAERAGMDALVIDSGSHEWAGIGGCSEMAEASSLKNDFAKWAFPKAQNKKYVNRLTNSGMHIIICLRAQEKYKQVDDPDKPGRKMIVNDGFSPICEKNLVYELVVSILMLPRPSDQEVGERILLKCPEPLVPIFSQPGWISENTGAQLAAWVAGGVAVDRNVELLKANGEEAALGGMASLKVWTEALSKVDRAAIKPHFEPLRAAAVAVDQERERIRREQFPDEEADEDGEITFDDPIAPQTPVATTAQAIKQPADTNLSPRDAALARIAATSTIPELNAAWDALVAEWNDDGDVFQAQKHRRDAIDAEATRVRNAGQAKTATAGARR